MVELVKLSPVKNVIQSTYSGLFVDEYQDCTIKQHGLMVSLSNLFPTRILGDFLQGIFGFNGERLVDMEDDVEMAEFCSSNHELQTPYRWINQNNPSMGADFKKIRAQLISKMEINILDYPSIEFNVIAEQDLFNPRSAYCSKIRKLLGEKDLLVIHPDSTSINPRVNVVKLFNNSLSLVESIDDKEFYQLSRDADSLTASTFENILISLCKRLFNKTGHDKWFNDAGFKKKTKKEDKDQIQPIELKILLIKKSTSLILLADILQSIKNLKGIKCYRWELFSTFCRALEEAELQNISVFDAMLNKRNLVRRVGRKVYGRCIGTTLLTKGLEFETVAIINAHKFKCPKHLYVALTRASKRLIVFSNSAILNPYKI
jgi:DNA helicase-2/ATP-dependent DNA helicase PcrA